MFGVIRLGKSYAVNVLHTMFGSLQTLMSLSPINPNCLKRLQVANPTVLYSNSNVLLNQDFFGIYGIIDCLRFKSPRVHCHAILCK
jgi:hypothetical protein